MPENLNTGEWVEDSKVILLNAVFSHWDFK